MGKQESRLPIRFQQEPGAAETERSGTAERHAANEALRLEKKVLEHTPALQRKRKR